MNNPIQILHLEDDALDAELIRAALESAGVVFQITRVQNRDEFTQALRQGDYDLILGDYRLPTYDGVSALHLARELRPDLPFIFVSGTLGEDAAIDGFTHGATDYVLKQKLSRLVPAIERALREAENQQMRQRAEAALQVRVQHSQSLLRLSKQLERAQTYDEILNAALAEVQAIIGYQNLWVYLLTEDRQHVQALTAGGHMSESAMTGEGIATLTIKGDRLLGEIIAATQIVIVEDALLDERTDKAIVARLGNRTIVNVPIILFDKHLGSVGTGTFGAEGVRAPTPSEQEYLMTMASHLAVTLDRIRLLDQRRQAEMQLAASEQLFRALVENSPDFIARYDREYRRIYVNPAMQKLFGRPAENVLGETPINQSPLYAPQVYVDYLRQVIETATESAMEMPYRTSQGEMHWGHMRFVPEFSPDGKVASVLAIGRDINEIKENERRFRMLAENFPDFVVRFDRNGRHTYVNPAVEKAFGLPAESIVGKTLQELPRHSNPEQNDALLTLIRQAFDEGITNETEARWNTVAGERIFEIHYVPEKDATGRVVTVLSIAHDITEIKRAERERLTHLQFLESLDQLNRAMQGTNDLDQMMSDVLDALLSIFDCDRAWLTYPCDPQAVTWQVSMERTRPEYPGVFPIGVDLPLDPMGTAVFKILRSATGPVKFGPEQEHVVPAAMAQSFNLQAFIAMAIYPKIGKPWSFGLHQCSYPRIWTPEEERLLQEIGRRLSDTLTSLLVYRNLRESEERFSTAFRFSPIAIGILRAADGRFVDVNDVFVRTAGYSREEIIGHTSNDLHFWANPERQAAIFQQLQAQGSSGTFEFEIRTKANEIRIGLSATAQIELSGEKHYLSLIHDITDRKRAEAALRESQALYHSFIEQLPNAVFRKDSEGRYVMVNSQFCRLKGLTAEDFLGKTPLEVARRESGRQGESGPAVKYVDQGEKAHDLIMRTGKIIETEEEHPRADGGMQYTYVIRMPVFDPQGKVVGTQGIHFDITDRKRAEARILRLNRLYATLSQINQTIVHVRDRASLFEQICRVAVEHGQFCLAWIGLIDEATEQIVPTTFAGEDQGYLANARTTYRDEPRGRGPTGTAIREGRCIICQDIATDPGMAPWREQALQRGYRSSAAVPIRQNGRVVGALTVYATERHSLDEEDEYLLDEIGLDISFALDGLEQEAQRQRAEAELSRLNAELEQRVAERTAELARAHERLRAILDTAGEGVVFTDPQGTIEYINPALERLTGYTADEALGHNPRIWKSDQTLPATHQHMWRALLNGEIWQGEVTNRRKDGELYDAALTTSPMTDLDGHVVGYVGVQRDITRQKELDRLKDQFVSNVSHELHTPIANIKLHLSLLTRGRPERHDIYLSTAQRETERLRRMIEDLLDLSRLDRGVTPIELVPIDVQHLLDQLITDRAALAGQRGLTLTYRPAANLPAAVADASKLMQVIANLLTNALNYTPAGGEVTVSSAARQQWITITVRDTGPGIAAKDLPHLFERFYRGEAGRKAEAPGTGLGLAISHEIMERLGGRITVESEPGHGAAFTVWVRADVPG